MISNGVFTKTPEKAITKLFLNRHIGIKNAANKFRSCQSLPKCKLKRSMNCN